MIELAFKKQLKLGIPRAGLERTTIELFHFTVESMVAESVVREIIPRSIDIGAEGIIEHSLNKPVGSQDKIG
jgi:hypothetical protein